MKNEKFEARKDNFMKKTRENHKLSLRKEKLESYFHNNREKNFNVSKELEIVVNSLDLSNKVKEEYFPDTFENAIDYFERFLKSNIKDEIKFGIYQTRKFLSNNYENRDYIQQLINRDFLMLYIGILEKYKDDDMTFEIIWCLINITSGITGDIILLKPNFVDILDRLLTHDHIGIVHDTLWLISNIVTDSHNSKIVFTTSPIFIRIKSIIENSKSIKIIRILTQMITNLVSNNKPRLSEKIIVYLTETILTYSTGLHVDEEVFLNCLASISSILESSYNSAFKSIFSSGILNKLINISPNEKIISKTNLIFGNILSLDDDNFENELINIGIIKYFAKVLEYESKKLKLEITWAISNLSFKKKEIYMDIINNTKIVQSIMLNSKDKEWKIRKESIWTLTNIITGSNFELCNEVVKMGILELVIENLDINMNSVIIGCCLEQLKFILCHGEIVKNFNKENPFIKNFREIGGIEVLKNLTKHNNTSIYQMTIEILTNFFEEQEDN